MVPLFRCTTVRHAAPGPHRAVYLQNGEWRSHGTAEIGWPLTRFESKIRSARTPSFVTDTSKNPKK